jgi:hypothetical protein
MSSATASQDVCFGTAWVEGRASPESPPSQMLDDQIGGNQLNNTAGGASTPYLPERQLPAPGTQLQFARRGLDASLLADLNVILTGMTYTEIAKAVRAGQPFNACVRRSGAYQPAPYHTAHVYECSVEFRKQMAALTPERTKDIAQNWYALLGHKNAQPLSPGRVEWRTEIIQNLAALARVAQERSTRLWLRAEYRMVV